jgi:hypothetical protein
MGKAGKGREKVGKGKENPETARKGGNYWVGQGKAGIRLGKVWENGKSWKRLGKAGNGSLDLHN